MNRSSPLYIFFPLLISVLISVALFLFSLAVYIGAGVLPLVASVVPWAWHFMERTSAGVERSKYTEDRAKSDANRLKSKAKNLQSSIFAKTNKLVLHWPASAMLSLFDIPDPNGNVKKVFAATLLFGWFPSFAVGIVSRSFAIPRAIPVIVIALILASILALLTSRQIQNTQNSA